MPITTLSSRELTCKAKKAARQDSVITNRGRPLTGESASLVDLLAMPDADTVEFEPAPVNTLYRPDGLDFKF